MNFYYYGLLLTSIYFDFKQDMIYSSNGDISLFYPIQKILLILVYLNSKKRRGKRKYQSERLHINIFLTISTLNFIPDLHIFM